MYPNQKSSVGVLTDVFINKLFQVTKFSVGALTSEINLKQCRCPNIKIGLHFRKKESVLMKRSQPNKKKFSDYSSLAEYEKSAKKSNDNKIEKFEIECVMEQIKKLEKLGIFIKM